MGRCSAAPLASTHQKPIAGDSRHPHNIQTNNVIGENDKCVFHIMGKKTKQTCGRTQWEGKWDITTSGSVVAQVGPGTSVHTGVRSRLTERVSPQGDTHAMSSRQEPAGRAGIHLLQGGTGLGGTEQVRSEPARVQPWPLPLRGGGLMLAGRRGVWLGQLETAEWLLGGCVSSPKRTGGGCTHWPGSGLPHWPARGRERGRVQHLEGAHTASPQAGGREAWFFAFCFLGFKPFYFHI